MKKKAKFLIIALEIILLIMFIIPLAFLGILNAGNAVGIILCAAALFATIYSDKLVCFFKKLCLKKWGKVLTGFVVILAGLMAVLVIVAGTSIMSAANNPPKSETTVIVLGCKVNPSGPSLMLKSRIDAAYEFLKENPDTKCIVSGGQGDDEHMSEAKCMYDELVKMGISKERVYIEDKSSTTRENIEFSKNIIEKENFCKDITIITNDFHQYRASRIAADHGLKSYNVPADTPVSMFPTYFLREIGGFIFEMVF